MFCDLVGSTASSEKLDPEELREILREYQRLCSEAIRSYEGYIARYMGDGILTYFCYPQAHEDDARRSVYAGLGIVGAMQDLSDRSLKVQGVRLEVRIGIHTGLVVVGEMGEGEDLKGRAITGRTPNIAARLQEIASPGSVVISSATYRMIEGFFNCQSLGLHSLKGITRPIELYQVLRESGVRSSLEARATGKLAPLVGRKLELGRIMESWGKARTSRGQVLLIKGEAGIGKSRLVSAFQEAITQEPVFRFSMFCSAYHQNSALYPVTECRGQVFAQKQAEQSSQKLDNMARVLSQYNLFEVEAIPLLADLLSVPFDNRYSRPNRSPQANRRKVLDVIVMLLLRMAQQQPLTLVVEDLHWADPSSLELLECFLDPDPGGTDSGSVDSKARLPGN